MEGERPSYLLPQDTLMHALLHTCRMHCLNIHACRRKYDANIKSSDKELFSRMPMKDPWHDADMTTVFSYMLHHPKTTVPDSWLQTMLLFERELLGTCADPSLIDNYNSMRSSWYQFDLIRCAVPPRNGHKISRNGRKNPQTTAKKKTCSIWCDVCYDLSLIGMHTLSDHAYHHVRKPCMTEWISHAAIWF